MLHYKTLIGIKFDYREGLLCILKLSTERWVFTFSSQVADI